MNGDPRLYDVLHQLDIPFQYHEHPPAPTIDIARQYWKDLDAAHCKNIFFRNHKGNKHYLVILEHTRELNIHELEKRLKQGKLSFASDERLKRHLGLLAGSVTPFGLINDDEKHTQLFIDKNLELTTKISFHPCINTASLVISTADLIRFLNWTGNTWEFTALY